MKSARLFVLALFALAFTCTATVFAAAPKYYDAAQVGKPMSKSDIKNTIARYGEMAARSTAIGTLDHDASPNTVAANASISMKQADAAVVVTRNYFSGMYEARFMTTAPFSGNVAAQVTNGSGDQLGLYGYGVQGAYYLSGIIWSGMAITSDSLSAQVVFDDYSGHLTAATGTIISWSLPSPPMYAAVPALNTSGPTTYSFPGIGVNPAKTKVVGMIGWNPVPSSDFALKNGVLTATFQAQQQSGDVDITLCYGGNCTTITAPAPPSIYYAPGGGKG